MKYTVLIAEDEKDIIEVIKLYLESDIIKVLQAENGEEAYEITKKNKVDLAVIDVMMPKMNGYELIKKIRMELNIPIIILSAKNQSADKVLGLNIGADDYITKPFDPLEFVARVNSQLRRYYKLGADKEEKLDKFLTVGELKLNTESLILYKNEIPIELTAIEYKIIYMLMKSPGRIYTKAQIYENISGDYFESGESTMMVHISNLRNKIGDDIKKPKYIKTIRGLGYKIEN